MKKILKLTLLYLIIPLIAFDSCISSDEPYIDNTLNKIEEITTYNITIINETDQSITKQNLNDLTLTDINQVYEQIEYMKYEQDITQYYQFITTQFENYNEIILKITQSYGIYNNLNIYMYFIQYNDNNTYYYKKYDGTYNSNKIYKWNIYGFKLINGNEFILNTFIYFKTMNNNTKEIYYIKIPMEINGTFNIQEQTCEFNFII